ncbi:acyltransferase [Aureimonas sp. AU20]|uniref:acyltransferase family protein n=1 Tax=Aureimonas sp. AU20 TaxID=1349819 RepID=UPI0007223AC6|nr:acyltransferase [Aureimonas sp. AU20]ALN72229.1 hypothetical protein M673_05845 [Aureimonas sp. AU20]
MTPPTQRPAYFESLDLVRGLAALVVLVYHTDFMFGLRGALLPGGYVAVDLFFVLSGFVLSLTYGGAIAGGDMGLRRFLLLRVARLYPLFLATTAVGFLVMTARFEANDGWIDTARLVPTGLLNALMLPSFLEPQGRDTLFPFNGATWSIFFEMVAGLLFFGLLARLDDRLLRAFTLAAGLGLVAAVLLFGSADIGWGTANFTGGFARVFFSFAVGMCLHRRYAAHPWRTPRWLFFALLALALALVQLKGALGPPEVYDLAMVGFLMPLLVAAGAGASLGRRLSWLARRLGDMSYGVYLNQGSLIILAAGASQALLGRRIFDLGPWVGFAFAGFVMLVSLATFHGFENPARRLLRQRRPRPAAGKARA